MFRNTPWKKPLRTFRTFAGLCLSNKHMSTRDFILEYAVSHTHLGSEVKYSFIRII
jgi:hypothetical protein